MKVLKPFIFGVLGGLALAMAVVIGLYFSPLREDLYFAADAEMADVRAKLEQYQEWLAQADLKIASDAAAAPEKPASDSLRNAQTKAWRDYKAWRNRLGELARAHDKPTADGFWPWTYSLGYWILPLAALLAILPGLFFALRARSRFRPGRVKVRPEKTGKPSQQPHPQKGAPKNARAQALANFEDAIKKVARISETERGNATPAPPTPVAQAKPPMPPLPDPVPPAVPPTYRKAEASALDRELDTEYGDAEPPRDARGRHEPPTSRLPSSGFEGSDGSVTQVEFPDRKEPDTAPFAAVDEPRRPSPSLRVPEPPPREPGARDPGRETAYFQMGAPWGEPAGERIGNPGAPGSPGIPGGPATPVKGRGLSMEDEDAPRGAGQAEGEGEEEEETLGVMPPTTEVERVERRKDEVLKLARKGMTSSEISRRMRISQDQVDFIIRLRREKG